MRRLLVICIGFATTAAQAQPAGRKASGGDALHLKAVENFVEAVIAERAGDYDRAIRAYENANRDSPHANTYYNIADLLRRMEKLEDAVKNYQKYLELAPKAADAAAVAKLVEQLQKTPGRAAIGGEDLDGVIYMDGKLVGPSPQVITIPDNQRHQIDRITPRSYDHRILVVSPMANAHVRFTAQDKDETGNVVLSRSPDAAAVLKLGTGERFHIPERVALKPGRHRATFDTHNGRTVCDPVEFDAPPAGQVAFVYFSTPTPTPASRDSGCMKITVTQSRVRFAP